MTDQSLADKFGVRLSRGATVFRQGDPGGSMYVIRAGKVRVLKDTQGRQRVVTTLGPGDFFGEIAVVTGRPRTATIEVLEDVELLRVPADKLQEMVSGTGEVAIRLIRHLAERLENANRFIDLLLEDDVTARVILELQETLQNAEGAAAPDVTDKDIALKLGIDKNDVRSALRRLTRVGILEVSSGFVLIKDTVRLGEFLEFIRSSGES
ncbi:MAG TPA: Crp/Fnr family transcriptional regulator [Polyangiales bacterium]|nr:Crp/Fnr family transcriptional regulator [Polyangiales bacterium]